ncbi:hypothetical protein D3C83_91560 [compost metagenome]
MIVTVPWLSSCTARMRVAPRPVAARIVPVGPFTSVPFVTVSCALNAETMFESSIRLVFVKPFDTVSVPAP